MWHFFCTHFVGKTIRGGAIGRLRQRQASFLEMSAIYKTQVRLITNVRLIIHIVEFLFLLGTGRKGTVQVLLSGFFWFFFWGGFFFFLGGGELLLFFFFLRAQPHPKLNTMIFLWSYVSSSDIPKLLCLPVDILPGKVVVFHSSVSLSTELLVNICVKVARIRQ